MMLNSKTKNVPDTGQYFNFNVSTFQRSEITLKCHVLQVVALDGNAAQEC